MGAVHNVEWAVWVEKKISLWTWASPVVSWHECSFVKPQPAGWRLRGACGVDSWGQSCRYGKEWEGSSQPEWRGQQAEVFREGLQALSKPSRNRPQVHQAQMSASGASCGRQPLGGAKYSSADTRHLIPKHKCKSRGSLPPVHGPWDLEREASRGEESSEKLGRNTSESTQLIFS